MFWLNHSYYQYASEQAHNIPWMSSKGQQRSARIWDLLLESQCAKEDGGLTGLKILHEPAFLKPLLVKLREDFQGRWQRHAYRFKSHHGVDYPPFREFASFIEEVARERMTPSYP